MDKKIIILSRVSTQPQDIHGQTKELKREAERLGYDENHQIIIESIESAIELSEDQRLGIITMKDYINNDPNVDCVICWEISRLSRRQKDLYSLRDYLANNKIQLYILNPRVTLLTNDRSQIDTNANLVFSLYATLSENEMSLKKERFIRAKNEMKLKGQKFGGATIFGYVKNKDKKCIPHPTNSKIIVDLFNYYISTDSSLYDTYLYGMGKYPEVFESREYKKAQRKMKHLFDTEVYVTGNWCYPPLITEIVWKKAHKKMSDAKCGPRFNCKRELLCRGKIYCGYCDAMMTGCGGNVKAYVCNNKDKYHSLQINCEIADMIMWEELAPNIAIHSHADYIHAINVTQGRIYACKQVIKKYEDKIISLKREQSKLLDLYLKNAIPEDTFNIRNNDYNTNLKIFSKNIEEIKTKLATYESILEESKMACEEDVSYKGIDIAEIKDFKTRVDYVRKYIKKMIVKKEEGAEHTMRITFEYTKPITRKESTYLYTYHNQGNVRVVRISEDGTETEIYRGNNKQVRNKQTGRFEKRKD